MYHQNTKYKPSKSRANELWSTDNKRRWIEREEEVLDFQARKAVGDGRLLLLLGLIGRPPVRVPSHGVGVHPHRPRWRRRPLRTAAAAGTAAGTAQGHHLAGVVVYLASRLSSTVPLLLTNADKHFTKVLRRVIRPGNIMKCSREMTLMYIIIRSRHFCYPIPRTRGRWKFRDMKKTWMDIIFN